jgi:hypothetical protein
LQFEQLLDEHIEGMVVRIGLAEGGEQARRGPASKFGEGWRGVAPRSPQQVRPDCQGVRGVDVLRKKNMGKFDISM